MTTPTPPVAARPTGAQIDALLEGLRAARALGRADRRYALLEYLLREEAAGRGDRIKAYALGTEVLGRGADFDPSTDSIVRVEIARIRDALALFYAGDAARGLMHVEIPKGTYRPVMTPPPEPEPAAPPPRAGRRARALPALRTAALLGVALLLGVGLGQAIPALRGPLLGFERAPLLEVDAFDAAPPVSDKAASLGGLRARLAQDLAGLGMLRVRLGAAEAAPDYVLDGWLEPAAGGPEFLVALSDGPNGEILWSRRFDMPLDEAAFSAAAAAVADGIAYEVGGRHGVVSRDQLNRLRRLADMRHEAPRAVYACLVIAHEFDLNKDPDDGRAARACLGKLVAENTRNSEVWSQWALMLFLDAAGIGAGRPAPGLMEQALAAARTAIRLDPYDAAAHEVAGSIHSALGDSEAALAAYRRAQELAPAKLFLRYLIAWQEALGGDWEGGIDRMEEAIAQMGVVPAHLRIPISIDRFQKGDYAAAYRIAMSVARAGDPRGSDMAYAAALAAGDCAGAADLAAGAGGLPAANPHLPLRRVRVTFSDPPPLAAYEAVLSRSPCA